jgi:predicted O-methyltransferase YrrM
VYTSVQLAKKYLRYYVSASNGKGHGMHSPFVFDFILNVLNNKNRYDPPVEIEQLREKLVADQRLIEIEDLGAGSRVMSSNQKKVSRLAKDALKPKKYAQLLYRLVKHYQPNTILELGTSLGLTTTYLSKANPSAAITTIEGSPAVEALATANFKNLHCTNIKLITGNFDSILPDVISHLPSLDLAYVDGNHRYEPTLQYFHQLLSGIHSDSILVFDDIHWSAGMEKAWSAIKAHPTVQYTIDTFFLGFVFFKKEFKVKQHFTIRF